MLVIYYVESNEAEAIDIRDDLRRNGIPAVVRNGAVCRTPFEYERCEAILTLECPDIADVYAARNELMRLADERGDIKQFASLNPVEIFTSAAEMYAALSGDATETEKQAATVDSSLTKQELIDLGATQGIALDMNMTKAQMIEKLT